jgi:hypothetical protein
MILSARQASIMKKTLGQLRAAFGQIKDDLFADGPAPLKTVGISVRFPRRLYFFIGGQSWVAMARKNKLHKKDMYQTPYR